MSGVRILIAMSNGNNAFGSCYHCKEAGRKHKIHFYLDTWEVGHDVPQSRNGGDSVFNVAPLHGRCNNHQRTKTFAQYHGQPSETASQATQRGQIQNADKAKKHTKRSSSSDERHDTPDEQYYKLIQSIKYMIDFLMGIKMTNNKLMRRLVEDNQVKTTAEDSRKGMTHNS